MEHYETPEITPQIAYDVVELPSRGIFYKNKKTTLKVTYLTAADENILSSPNLSKGNDLLDTLLKSKILDKDINIQELAECDRQAIYVFLRNTAFGSEYTFNLTDPADGKSFTHTEDMSIISIKDIDDTPDAKGEFPFTLPKSGKKAKLKLLGPNQEEELAKLAETYKNQKISPLATKRLEKCIVELDGERDIMELSRLIHLLPIKDSQEIRKYLQQVTPGLDLDKTAIAPSGREVKFTVTFGVSFFRPFFGI